MKKILILAGILIFALALVACDNINVDDLLNKKGDEDASSHTHSMTKVERVEATCNTDGNIEYYICEKCQKLYLDEKGETETSCSDIVIKVEHNYVDRVCTICGDNLGTEGLEYTLNPDGASYSVTGIGSAKGSDIVIPAMYEGLPVTAIGDKAFYGQASRKSVTIGDNVITIGEQAFYNCIGFKSVIIGKSVTDIGFRAFYSCTGLTNIIIPDSVEIIGEYAFQDCRALTNITIGNSVTAIEKRAFYGCENLIEVVIPDSVTTIGDYAFYNLRKLISVTIGAGVESIGTDAFNNCLKLAEVSNKSQLNIKVGSSDFGKVGYYALEVHGEDSKIVNHSNYLFYTNNDVNYLLDYLGSDTDLVLPEDYNGESYVIYKYAFYKKHTVKSVVISNKVTSIDVQAFAYSQNITDVIISEGVTSIGANAFFSCKNLKSITIPNGVTSVGNEAFRYCESLTNAIIPNSIETIGTNAFSDCKNLQFNEYDNGYYLGNENNPYLVMVMAKDKNIESCVIHSDTKIIMANAFSSCYHLVSVTIGENVTFIGDYAFEYCYKIVEVINKSSLNITIGSNDYGALARWAKEVHKGASKVTMYNGYLFYEYDNVNYLMGYLGNETELVLPEGYNGEKYEIYKYAFYSNEEITKVTIPNGVVSIGEIAFGFCDNMTSITIGNEVVSIGEKAFYKCPNLSDVTIPESVTSIGQSAFLQCTSLVRIVIPDSVEFIDEHAFDGCNKMTSITIGNGVTAIRYQTFAGCTKLESVIIGSGVSSIESYSFTRCTSLTSVYYLGSADEWSEIKISSSSTDFTNATIYYYAETQPTTEGNFWHYVDGVPTIW